MEIIFIAIISLLIGVILYNRWKIRCLKHDIYTFAEKLDKSLHDLLNGELLDIVECKQDDLWGMVYEKLYRVSELYNHKNKEILEEKKNLKELVSDLSHQIKTPLANIKLYQEILLGEINILERADYLKKMGGQVNKLDFLLQSMVKISRLEAGTIKIHKAEKRISETLVPAIEALIPKADNKKISIYVSYDETLHVNHDKKWTGEAILNILDNAIKYTSSGGNIHISVSREDIFTKISIADTGKGISLERQGRIFTRFYREPEVHNQEGVGIGLYLARKIISLQGGYIKVESEVGKGSTFYMYLLN